MAVAGCGSAAWPGLAAPVRTLAVSCNSCCSMPPAAVRGAPVLKWPRCRQDAGPVWAEKDQPSRATNFFPRISGWATAHPAHPVDPPLHFGVPWMTLLLKKTVSVVTCSG
jgi:hypothetical protein